MKAPVVQRGFTLIELLVVIGIIALLAAFAVPAIGNMRRSDALTAAARQLQDDVGRARQLAISKHTTVYMVFVPLGFYSDTAYTAAINTMPAALQNQERVKGTNLMGKQLTGYCFVSLRSVGDQPGQGTPDYIGPWRTMPEGTFLDTNKFALPTSSFTGIKDPPGSATPDRTYQVYGFSWTNGIPFPSEEVFRPGATYVSLPYIAFNYLGQLVSGVQGKDEFLPITRGSVLQPRHPQTKQPVAGLPSFREDPPGNSSNAFNLIQIDRLTGRARLVQPEIRGS